PKREPRRDAQRLVLHYLVPCMNAYGLCIVDRFLGSRPAERVLQEVLALHLSDRFQDGALAGQKPPRSKAIRGDQVVWVEGTEPGCQHIGGLLKRMDKLVLYADGKLGRYKIRGRHKVSSSRSSSNSSLWVQIFPPILNFGASFSPQSVYPAAFHTIEIKSDSWPDSNRLLAIDCIIYTEGREGGSGGGGKGREGKGREINPTPTMPLGHIMRVDLEKIALGYVVPCLHDIGFCYLDNFLGELVGDCVLERVKQMHFNGELQDGQLAGQRKGIAKRHLRGDQIKWIAGTEEGCEAINFLLSLIDRLVMYCGSRLGKYYVKERSKVRTLLPTWLEACFERVPRFIRT
ncbi:hypothetical protein JD844_021116, partial [Phrynosoma platyrhinos]